MAQSSQHSQSSEAIEAGRRERERRAAENYLRQQARRSPQNPIAEAILAGRMAGDAASSSPSLDDEASADDERPTEATLDGATSNSDRDEPGINNDRPTSFERQTRAFIGGIQLAWVMVCALIEWVWLVLMRTYILMHTSGILAGVRRLLRCLVRLMASGAGWLLAVTVLLFAVVFMFSSISTNTCNAWGVRKVSSLTGKVLGLDLCEMVDTFHAKTCDDPDMNALLTSWPFSILEVCSPRSVEDQFGGRPFVDAETFTNAASLIPIHRAMDHLEIDLRNQGSDIGICPAIPNRGALLKQHRDWEKDFKKSAQCLRDFTTQSSFALWTLYNKFEVHGNRIDRYVEQQSERFVVLRMLFNGWSSRTVSLTEIWDDYIWTLENQQTALEEVIDIGLTCIEQLTVTDQAWKETDDMMRDAVHQMSYEEKAEAGESPWWRSWFGSESEHVVDLRTSQSILTTVSGIDHTAVLLLKNATNLMQTERDGLTSVLETVRVARSRKQTVFWLDFHRQSIRAATVAYVTGNKDMKEVAANLDDGNVVLLSLLRRINENQPPAPSETPQL